LSDLEKDYYDFHINQTMWKAFEIDDLRAQLRDCYIFLSAFPNFGMTDIQFPPPKNSLVLVEKQIGKSSKEKIPLKDYLYDLRSKIESGFPTVINGNEEESTQDMLVDAEQLERFTSYLESFSESIDLSKKSSFAHLSDNFKFLFFLHCVGIEIFERSKREKLDTNDVCKFYGALERATCRFLAQGNSLIGYWRAKVEVKKRNFKSSKVKTEKRIRNLDIVKKLITENNNRPDRDLILRAMAQIDRGERTVKEMIKEITGEGTQ
jgi:hypothetical protein